MSYKIKVYTGGVMKLDVIENGESIRRKLVLGEIVEVGSIDKGEMEAGYYKVVRQELITSTSTPKIQREPQKILQPNGQAAQQSQQLEQLIDGMKTMIGVAEQVLNAAGSKPEAPAPVEVPVADQDGNEISSDFTISEDESQEDIYDQKSFKEGNEQYQRVVENTTVFMMGGQARDQNGKLVRNVHKIGDIASKKMPAVSEAKLGKMKRKTIPAIVDERGKIINQQTPGKTSVKVVTDKEGNVDVLKTLNWKLANKPGQGFDIDGTPAGGIDI